MPRKKGATGSKRKAAVKKGAPRYRKVPNPKQWQSSHRLARAVLKTALELSSVPKDIAVAAAVGGQLRQDKKWPPNDANRPF